VVSLNCCSEGSVNVLDSCSMKRTLPLLLLSETSFSGLWKLEGLLRHTQEYLSQHVKPKHTSAVPFFFSREKQKGEDSISGFTRNMLFRTVCFSTRQHPLNIFPLCTLFSTFQSTRVKIAKNLIEWMQQMKPVHHFPTRSLKTV